MDNNRLVNIIRAMKLEILYLLANHDLRKDKQAQRVLLTIDNMFKRLDKDIETVMPQAVLKSYFEGLAFANEQIFEFKPGDKQISLALDDGQLTKEQRRYMQATLQNQAHMDAVAEITENSMLDLKAARRTAQTYALNTIAQALAETQRALQSGIIRGDARRKITARVSEAFEKNGMTSFICKDGSRLPLDVYAETVTATNLRRAAVAACANRYQEREIHLFTVSGNTPTCSKCAAYRNVTFTMDPDESRFPYLNPTTFPLHPRCRCTIIAFNERLAKKSEVDAAIKKGQDFSEEMDKRPEHEKEAYKNAQRINRMNNYEKKRYAEIKAVMGDKAPKTLGAFKRMKRAQSKNYLKLLSEFQKTKNNISGG